MTLRDVSLYLCPEEYERLYRSAFGFHARYLCNFVRRKVIQLKFKADRVGQICVQGSRTPKDEPRVLGEHAAVACVLFNQDRYDSLKSGEHHEFYIAMLVDGLERCAHYHSIPLQEILGFIDDFRRGGYKNEWVHQSKLLRGTGLRASLLCSMDSERFALRLKLERKGETVFDEQILETKPDEIIFAHQFKDVVLQGRKVVVRAKYHELPGKPPLFSLNLADLE